jgi:hypothetical protein
VPSHGSQNDEKHICRTIKDNVDFSPLWMHGMTWPVLSHFQKWLLVAFGIYWAFASWYTVGDCIPSFEFVCQASTGTCIILHFREMPICIARVSFCRFHQTGPDQRLSCHGGRPWLAENKKSIRVIPNARFSTGSRRPPNKQI